MSEYEREARRERLEALRQAGVDPFPARVAATQRIRDIRSRFDSVDAEALEAQGESVSIAGRIMAKRKFGKLMFVQLREDGSGLQVSVRKQEVSAELFDFAKDLDVGDFVRVEGPLWRTKTDELTVDLREMELLAKSLRPLPEKWHGLSDVETRFRQRYLDLLVNEDARRIALLRSRIVKAMRAFLDQRDFIEVETPVLQPLYGGAAAQPFTTHHKTYSQDLYLRISDELYLKRLVVGGIERVYEIAHNFRNEGVSRKHNPEFTMMECYQAYADYRDMMDLTQAMVQEIAEKVLETTSVVYQGAEIELGGTWPRISMRDAIFDACGVDILSASGIDELREAIRASGREPGDGPTWGAMVDDLFSECVEPKLVQPTFIIDYPVDLSPLAKRSAHDPRVVERFEIFIAGMELGNAFSELNDPIDQRERFLSQREAHDAGDKEAHPLDEDYLRALEQGLPPTGGLGIGVDRLVMVLTDAPNLRETVLFPHIRPES